MLWIAWSDPGCVAGLPPPASLTYGRRISMETILPLHPQPVCVCWTRAKNLSGLQSLLHPCGERHLVQWSPESSSSLLIGNIFWQDKRENFFLSNWCGSMFRKTPVAPVSSTATMYLLTYGHQCLINPSMLLYVELLDQELGRLISVPCWSLNNLLAGWLNNLELERAALQLRMGTASWACAA